MILVFVSVLMCIASALIYAFLSAKMFLAFPGWQGWVLAALSIAIGVVMCLITLIPVL